MIRRGRFARWNEKEYGIISRDKQIYLTTNDITEMQNGFAKARGLSGVLIKKIDLQELEDAYEVVPYAIVEGYRFAIETSDLRTRYVKLVTNNTFASKRVAVQPYGTGQYMIELPIESVSLEEDCIPILGFENKYA